MHSSEIVKSWKKSAGLSKYALEKLSPNELELLKDVQYNSLDDLHMDLNDIRMTIEGINDYIGLIDSILGEKYNEELKEWLCMDCYENYRKLYGRGEPNHKTSAKHYLKKMALTAMFVANALNGIGQGVVLLDEISHPLAQNLFEVREKIKDFEELFNQELAKIKNNKEPKKNAN